MSTRPPFACTRQRAGEDLLGSLDTTLDARSLNDFIELFTAVADGRTLLQQESTALTLRGKRLSILVRAIIPGEKDTYPYMLVNVIDITELKELQDKLVQERSILRTVIDTMPDQIFVKDRAGKFTLVNRTLMNRMGRKSPEDIIGKTEREFFPKSVADRFRADDKEILRTGATRTNMEEEIVSADGTRWALTTKVPLRDSSGRITGIVGVVRDITERRDLQRKIEEERSVLREVITNVPDGIFLKDREGRFIVANRAIAELMQAGAPEELIGKTDFDFYPRDMALESQADEREVIGKGEKLINQEEPRTVKGTLRWILTTKVPVRDAEGTITGLVGITRDISTLEEAETALRQSEENFRAIFMEAPVGIFRSTFDGKLISVNPAFARMLGYDSPEHLIETVNEKSAAEVVYADPTQRSHVVEDMERAPGWIKIQNRYRHRNGRVVTVNLMTRVRTSPGSSRKELEGFVEDITERIEAETALRQSEENFRAIFMEAPVGIFRSTFDGKLISVNPAFARMLGYDSPEHLIETVNEKSAAEVVYADPTQRSHVIEDMERSPGWIKIQNRYRHRNGRVVIVNLMTRVRTSPGSSRKELEGFVEDITERIEAETALARERAFLTALMDTIPDHIYFKDRESRFILLNKAQAKDLGAGDPSKMLGKTDFDYFPATLAQKAFDNEQRIIATGVPVIDAVEKEAWAGSDPLWVSATKMPLRDAKGEIIGTFGISRDITDRRQMEERNVRLAEMVDSSNDAIIGMDTTYAVTSWNKGAEKIFGYTAEEMIGTSITPLLSPELMAREPEIREHVRQEGELQDLESPVTRKDGQLVYVSTSISLVKDASGQTVGVTCISRDVTAQKAMQVQIIRAQRLESLGTLAAGIAHQFNNINTAAKAYLDFVARDQSLAASARSHIQEALKAVQRAVDITERLQGLTSASASSPERMKLGEAVRAMIPLFEKQMEEEGISMPVDLDQTAAVLASHGMLSFILTSLVSNSIHALIGRASPTITVRTRAAGGFSSLEVSDNGCGISPENTPRIFTPFFTTKGEWAEPGSTQARVKGIGLSLSVCQSSVAESGGWIEVESTKGVGTTFRVWLPAAAPDKT